MTAPALSDAAFRRWLACCIEMSSHVKPASQDTMHALCERHGLTITKAILERRMNRETLAQDVLDRWVSDTVHAISGIRPKHPRGLR